MSTGKNWDEDLEDDEPDIQEHRVGLSIYLYLRLEFIIK